MYTILPLVVGIWVCGNTLTCVPSGIHIDFKFLIIQEKFATMEADVLILL